MPRSTSPSVLHRTQHGHERSQAARHARPAGLCRATARRSGRAATPPAPPPRTVSFAAERGHQRPASGQRAGRHAACAGPVRHGDSHRLPARGSRVVAPMAAAPAANAAARSRADSAGRPASVQGAHGRERVVRGATVPHKAPQGGGDARLVHALGRKATAHRVRYLTEEQPPARQRFDHSLTDRHLSGIGSLTAGRAFRNTIGRRSAFLTKRHLGAHRRKRGICREEGDESRRGSSLCGGTAGRTSSPTFLLARAVTTSHPQHVARGYQFVQHPWPKIAHASGQHLPLPRRSRQKHAFELGYDLRDPIRAFERSRTCGAGHVLQIQHQTDESATGHRLHGSTCLGKRA